MIAMDVRWIAALSALLALAASSASAIDTDIYDAFGPSDLSRSEDAESCRSHEDGSVASLNLEKRQLGALFKGLSGLTKFGGAGRIAPKLGRSASLPAAFKPSSTLFRGAVKPAVAKGPLAKLPSLGKLPTAGKSLGRSFSLPAAGKAPILTGGKGIPSTAGLVADDVAKLMAKDGRVVQQVIKDSSGQITSITYAKPGKLGMLVKFELGAAVGVSSMLLVNALIPIKPPNLFEGEPEVVQFPTPEELAGGAADPNAAAAPNATPAPEAPAPPSGTSGVPTPTFDQELGTFVYFDESTKRYFTFNQETKNWDSWCPVNGGYSPCNGSGASSSPAAPAFNEPAFNDATGWFYCATDNSVCNRLANETSSWDANCLDNADGKYRECNPARPSAGTCLSDPQLDTPSNSWFCLADETDNINVLDRFTGVWVPYCPSGDSLVPCSESSGTPPPAATANAAPPAAETAPPAPDAAAAAETTPPAPDAAAAAETTPQADAAVAAETTPQAPDAAPAA